MPAVNGKSGYCMKEKYPEVDILLQEKVVEEVDINLHPRKLYLVGALLHITF